MNPKAFFSVLLSFACLVVPAFSEIEAGQSVIIKIMGVPADQKVQIDETYPVSNKGMVNLPFIGELPASGLESDELAKAIQKAYRDNGIFNNPTIQVISTTAEVDVVAQVVHLGGQVRNPGPRPFTKGLTVFQAVQAGGGATEFGAMNRVILWREGKQQEIDLGKADGKAVISMPNDTIEVPRKRWNGK